MSRSDKTKRPRTRSSRDALQSSYTLVGPDAADSRDRMAPTLEDDEQDTEPDPTQEDQKSKTVLLFGDEVKGFNYDSLPSDVADKAREIASKIRKAADTYYYRAGDYLTSIRPEFEHGQWEAWVELEVGISPQVARNYMLYDSFAQDFGLDVAQLFLPSVVYRLASAPNPVKLLLIKRAEAGQHISILDVRQAERDAHPQSRPALNDSGDDQGEGAPDRLGDDTEGDADHADTHEQLDEKTNPCDDRLHGIAIDFADELVAVLRDLPSCCWFQQQAHDLISDALQCQEVLVRVDARLAVLPGRKPSGADLWP